MYIFDLIIMYAFDCRLLEFQSKVKQTICKQVNVLIWTKNQVEINFHFNLIICNF
jgi:hypothetical protein